MSTLLHQLLLLLQAVSRCWYELWRLVTVELAGDDRFTAMQATLGCTAYGSVVVDVPKICAGFGTSQL